MSYIEKCKKAAIRFEELEKLLADNEVISDKAQYQKIAKEYSDITPIVTAYNEYEEVLKQLAETEKMIADGLDADMKELVLSEKKDLIQKKSQYEEDLDNLVNPKAEEKDHNLIFEIRAGTGGEEASLFAGDLFRMYSKYCDAKGWTVETMNFNESETGGFKEVVFGISGKGASKLLKFESGVHRVQRVPTTEASGRIHTSAATVAVMLEPEEVDLDIKQEDLRIDIFRASGPGGQSVNTTDSAVRITHLPTGTVVICQDERSQLKNKAKAMRVLRARIQDKIMQENIDAQAKDRKSKVGTGDRSEKIRTYNYPDRRVTDHRIGFTTHKLQYVMDGALDEIMEALQEADKEETVE